MEMFEILLARISSLPMEHYRIRMQEESNVSRVTKNNQIAMKNNPNTFREKRQLDIAPHWGDPKLYLQYGANECIVHCTCKTSL